MTKEEAIAVIKLLAPGCEITTMAVSIEGHEFIYDISEKKWMYEDETEDDDETIDAEVQECNCSGGEFCDLCMPRPGRDIGT